MTLLVGAVAFVVIWGVESLRKGEAMFFWPVIPIVAWALAAIFVRWRRLRSRA